MGALNHDGIRTHRGIGSFALPERHGKWNREISKVKTSSGKTGNRVVVVNPIRKMKEETQ